MSSVEEMQAMVLVNGTSKIKAGWAGDDRMRCNISTIVGRRRHRETMADAASSSSAASSTPPKGERCYIGEDAQQYREMLSLSHPIQHGIITNWEDMEKVWRHTFEVEMRVDTHEGPVLLTEPALNPLSQREKVAQYMFERFEVPAMYVAITAILAAYSGGRTSCISLKSGDGVTNIVPIYEGHAIKEAIQRIDFGGGDLTDYLAQMIQDEHGISFNTSASRETAREIKEKLSYVALDYESEMKRAKESPADFEKDYKLPDGRVIKLGSERFRVGEALFNPTLFDKDTTAIGLHHLVYNAIQACEVDLRADFYNNIYFTGGTTFVTNAADRLQKEMRLFPISPKCARTLRVIAPSDSLKSVFYGGSILASLSTFQQEWITRSEYEEHGPRIVQRKSHGAM